MKQITFRTLFSRYKYTYIAGFIALIVTDSAQLIIPRIIKQAIDSLVDGKNPELHLLAVYSSELLILAAIIFLFRFFWRILTIGNSWKISRDLREILFRHLETQPPSFYRNHESGKLMALMTNDIEAIRMSAGFGIVAAIDAIFMATLSLTMMLFIDVRLTLIALIPMPLIALLVLKFGKLLFSKFESVQSSFAGISGHARETFAGIRVLKAFAQEEAELAKFSKLSTEYRDRNMSLAWIRGNFFPMVQLLAQLSSLIILWIGGLGVIKSRITIGDFVAFNAYIGILTWPMMAVGFVTNMYQRGKASMHRINKILAVEPEVSDPENPITLENCRGEIEFRSLSCSYDENGNGGNVLKNISFKIKPGEKIGITGRIGSGKSTIVKLLTRLYNPPKGTVFIDGTDILDISLESLRKSISTVPQHPFMFSDTIGYNILLGNPSADRKKAEELLDLVRLSEVESIRKLDFDTMVGEDGITLSGGQKQRATIARGLIRESAILILDDVLSSVDTKTEDAILRELPRYLGNRTSIIISHRISAIRDTDRIFVFDDGKLVEEGTHEELSTGNGFYAELCRKQKLMNFNLE